MAGTLQEKTEALAARFTGGGLRKSDLEAWIAASREASALIVRSLHVAADLVNSFKLVAVDQASAQRRSFDLARACQEIMATMMNQVRRRPHARTAGRGRDRDGQLSRSPGPGRDQLRQQRAAACRRGIRRVMVLAAARIDGDRVRIEFRDDGRGIPQEYVVVFFDCLHHAVDEVGALRSAWRALRPGGICITSEPGRGHARRSAAVMAEFGVTERDMHPARIIHGARRAGFRRFTVRPHAHYLYIALYRRDRRGLLGKLLRFPGMRALVALGTVLFSQHQAGIVVLEK